MWGAESPHLLKNGVFPQVVEASDWLSVSGGRGAGMKPVRLTRFCSFRGGQCLAMRRADRFIYSSANARFACAHPSGVWGFGTHAP